MLVRLRDGWIDLFEDEVAGYWLVAWTPDRGERRTYSPHEGNPPADYPGGDDPAELLRWARRQFGGCRPR